jgi:hypothetical protein
VVSRAHRALPGVRRMRRLGRPFPGPLGRASRVLCVGYDSHARGCEPGVELQHDATGHERGIVRVRAARPLGRCRRKDPHPPQVAILLERSGGDDLAPFAHLADEGHRPFLEAGHLFLGQSAEACRSPVPTEDLAGHFGELVVLGIRRHRTRGCRAPLRTRRSTDRLPSHRRCTRCCTHSPGEEGFATTRTPRPVPDSTQSPSNSAGFETAATSCDS